jgi:broad specificity phosphatase PhoE
MRAGTDGKTHPKMTMTTTRLRLVRHGQTAWGGATYRDLTETGEAQSRRLGEHFAREGYRPDAVLVGPLPRHERTAALLVDAAAAAGLALPAPERVDGLDEIHATMAAKQAFVAWAEGDDDRGRLAAQVLAGTADKDAILRLFKEATARWMRGEIQVPDAEPLADFRRRIGDTLDGIARRGGEVLAVTSGGVIAAAVGHALGAADRIMEDLVFGTWSAGWADLAHEDGRWQLRAFNATPHLEGGLRTHW